jgi:hypothetical protein
MNNEEFGQIYRTMEPMYITPYKYRVELNIDFCQRSNNNFIIYFDNLQMVVPEIYAEFFSMKQLTIHEVVDKLKGTKGIKSISGEFKDE